MRASGRIELPPSTLAWIAGIGGGRVTRVWRLEGGVQAETHAVDLTCPDGAIRPLVVRRFRIHDAASARSEAANLLRLAGSGLPVAEMVGADPEAEETDLPATLQTRLEGVANLDPEFALARLDQLGAVLARLHDLPLPLVAGFSDKSPLMRKAFSEDPPLVVAAEPGGLALWERARAVSLKSNLETPVLLHGDFHIGNVIWQEGQLAGVVDWSSASLGPAAKDVSYCRMDLALVFGGDAPDRFLAGYVEAAKRRLPDLALWDAYMASVALTEATQWLPGWWGLGRVDLTAELVRSRTSALVRSIL